MFTIYLLYMFTKCSLYVHYMFTICSLYVHYIFTIFSPYVHHMFTIYSYMFTIYSLYVHYMFTICSLYTYTHSRNTCQLLHFEHKNDTTIIVKLHRACVCGSVVKVDMSQAFNDVARQVETLSKKTILSHDITFMSHWWYRYTMTAINAAMDVF